MLFERFSERAQMVIFLTRMDAGKRGAKAMDPNHLLDAIVREDQGELAKRFQGHFTPSGPVRPPDSPFFSAETATDLQGRLQHEFPIEAVPLPDSTDMPVSPALALVFTTAAELSQELHHSHVEPLHLLASILSDETSQTTRILKEAGIAREAVLAALQK